ncbi:MAG: ATP-binding protein [Bacteroidota bacterium]|nr:ATP-binding protein [Bacteroidota bacterium]MDP4215632.1 ATP-binding protein [Bacteroidota bacterium]MDP4245593.1 ATP-binding protein [Bacteroidota bacterium]MDP4253683.1 ATP-binding protein [Bacteroidota bacterium]MDP4259579.1 ATP-binding protein [Bacteroidota bacterium]
MFKEKSPHILLFCSIVTLTTGVLQWLNPALSFFDGGLLIAILLTIFLKKDGYTTLFGGISVALVIAASFYPQEGVDQRQILFQHLFALITVVLATVFVLYLKKLYRSLESEQQQVKALFEHAAEGIILTDDQGKIVLLNPAAYRLFQYDQDELPGQSIDVLIPQRFHHRHAANRESFYHHPGNRSMGMGRDLFARRKDGSEFPVEISLGHYQQLGRLFVIAFVVDITQRKLSERELLARQKQLEKITEDMRSLNTGLEAKVEQRTFILREALQELEKSQEELSEALSKEKELGEIKSRFVSMASHEFRTPLSTILSSANLLSRYTSTEDQDKRDKHIKRTKDAVKHLNNLLEDFLSLGKLQEGKIKADPSPFSVRDLLEEVTEEMQSLAKEGQVIHCRYDGDRVLVSDKRMVKNILINLLSNAVKFSAEGAPIELGAKSRPAGIAISVRDEGIGISIEDRQHLFSSFFRGANVINIEGTGLGLHIVKRYLDLLHGSIQLDSELGKGTVVTIELPSSDN